VVHRPTHHLQHPSTFPLERLLSHLIRFDFRIFWHRHADPVFAIMLTFAVTGGSD
jgi:hypothetical protein